MASNVDAIIALIRVAGGVEARAQAKRWAKPLAMGIIAAHESRAWVKAATARSRNALEEAKRAYLLEFGEPLPMHIDHALDAHDIEMLLRAEILAELERGGVLEAFHGERFSWPVLADFIGGDDDRKLVAFKLPAEHI